MSETIEATEPRNATRAARIAAIMPAYIATLGDASKPDDPDTLRDLLTDALHYANTTFGEGQVVELLADVLRNFSSEAQHVAAATAGDTLDELLPEKPEPLLRVFYVCPINFCGETWEEEYESACDSTCPKCGTENIEADRWEEI